MSKKKTPIARLGSFEIFHELGADFNYIRIKAIGGHWALMYRSDSPMYGAWLSMARDPESHKGLEVLCVMAYHLTNSILDKEFVDDFFAAFESLHNRSVATAPEPSEEENNRAIEEAAILQGEVPIISGEVL